MLRCAGAVAAAILMASCGRDVPSGTIEVRHLFDAASRPAHGIAIGVEWATVERLAQRFPPTTPSRQLVSYIESVGGTCTELAPTNESTCIFENTNYSSISVGYILSRAVSFTELKYRWKISVIEQDETIQEVNVNVTTQERSIDRAEFIAGRLRQQREFRDESEKSR